MISLEKLLQLVVRINASDVFVTAEKPVCVKVNGLVREVNSEVLDENDTRKFANGVMNAGQREEFEATKECNFSIQLPDIGRFRVNVFVQRGKAATILRKINIHIPTLAELNMPPVMTKIVMQKRGLVLLVGGTGTGKSTTLAAMLSHRNEHNRDHIITIEDPIEFLHQHKKSIITQREVGVDTDSFAIALKNAMRQAPDVIQIGEIRDADTMHNAVAFAETGHLCLATLHANNTYQALDRILSFYGSESREQLFMELSMNLNALVSQRLVPTIDGQNRVAALEVMVNTPLIADLIQRGELHKIPDVIERSRGLGLQTFDQSLFDLYKQGLISSEDAIKNADSENNLRLRIKLEANPEDQKSDKSKEDAKEKMIVV